MDRKRILKDYVEPIVVAILIALFVRTFIVQAFKIPSGQWNLLCSSEIICSSNKFIYGIRIPFTGTKLFELKKPQRGDVIVFVFPLDPSKDLIKRVITTEGERHRSAACWGQPGKPHRSASHDPCHGNHLHCRGFSLREEAAVPEEADSSDLYREGHSARKSHDVPVEIAPVTVAARLP